MTVSTADSYSGFGRLILLFLGITMLLLAIIGTHTLSRFSEQAALERQSKLERLLDRGVAQSTVSWYVLKHLRAFTRVVRRHNARDPWVQRAFQKLITQRSISCTAYIYRNRELISHYPANAAHLKTFSGILRDLHLTGEAFKLAQRRYQQALLDIFGPGNRLELLLRFRGKLRRFTRADGSGAYLIHEFSDGWGFIFVLPRLPEFSTRFLAARREISQLLGAAVPNDKLWFPPAGNDATQMQLALQRTIEEGRPQVQYNNQEWIFCQNREGVVWCIAQPLPISSIGSNVGLIVTVGYLLSAVCFLLFALSSWGFAWGLAVTERLDSLGIRFRLVLLFGMATILPLGTAILLGSIGLGDRRELLLAETGRAGLARLSQAERSYNTHIEAFRRVASDLRDSPLVKNLQLELLASTVARLVQSNAIQRFEIRDSAGKLLFTTDDREVHGVTQATDLFSRTAIRHEAPNRMGQSADKVSPEEIMAESILSRDDVGLSAILRQPKTVHTFRMGTTPCLWYWDTYPELATGPCFFAVAHQVELVYDEYIRRTFGLKMPREAKSLKMAFEVGSEWTSYRTYPRLRGSGWLPLLCAAARSQETGRVLFRELELPSGRYWVTIKPELTLGTFVFADLVPVATQLKTLEPIRWRLFIISFLALLIYIMGARLISSFFLQPIDDLGKGIGAIRQRNASFRIPRRRQDEFGMLANAFNNLLSELKEIEYGRIVQESLLPADPLAPEGWTIACHRIPATDLAGDYHDVFPLEDGRWGFIIGDVTGHGISAALAMAMAKATVDYQHLKRWAVPTQVLDKLNLLFYRELKPRQKFMTLTYIVLDPKSGEFIVENAGHPYPLIYRAKTQTVIELSLPSMPLGARKIRKAKSHAERLDPGDALLMYSDGILECPDPWEQPFNHHRLHDLFERLMKEEISPLKALRIMEETLHEYHGPGPFPDDITLLLVMRGNQGNSPT